MFQPFQYWAYLVFGSPLFFHFQHFWGDWWKRRAWTTFPRFYVYHVYHVYHLFEPCLPRLPPLKNVVNVVSMDKNVDVDKNVNVLKSRRFQRPFLGVSLHRCKLYKRQMLFHNKRCSLSPGRRMPGKYLTFSCLVLIISVNFSPATSSSNTHMFTCKQKVQTIIGAQRIACSCRHDCTDEFLVTVKWL